MKRQVFIIHGGDSFLSQAKYLSFLRNREINLDRYRAGQKGWKDSLYEKLGPEYEVFLPAMPNSANAKYAEWELWFNKIVPYINPGSILIGHSLGGLFLAKYLSKNKLPHPALGTFLVGACYAEGDFTAPKDFGLFEKQAGKIFLYHSKDDSIVPFHDLEKFSKKLPSAVLRVFDNQWHFVGETVPGLVKDIKNLN